MEEERTVPNFLKKMLIFISSARRFCRFIVDGVVYEYLGLPMGLSCSPRNFTRVYKAAPDWLRKRGVLSHLYWWYICSRRLLSRLCMNKVHFVVQILEKLGFLINFKKSVMLPDTSVKFLGTVWNLKEWTASVTMDQEKSLRETAPKLRKNL